VGRKKSKEIENILNMEQEVVQESRASIAQDIYHRLRGLFLKRVKNGSGRKVSELTFSQL
jgi:hypothetical protein